MLLFLLYTCLYRAVTWCQRCFWEPRTVGSKVMDVSAHGQNFDVKTKIHLPKFSMQTATSIETIIKPRKVFNHRKFTKYKV